MPRLIRPPLLAIIAAIDGIETAIGPATLQDYSGNWLLKHAVERAIEIISEAFRRVPVEVQNGHPEIPWKEIMAVGNILRHNYDRIADRIIYEIVARDLPALKTAVSAILAELNEPET